jgi:L-threonylcarbamoyladenylate synthase
MLILSFRESDSERIIAESLNILKNGGVIAYPTESFYALGVLATDEIAVRKLFELKKRPAEKPLPIIVGSLEVLRPIVKSVPAQAESLMEKYWPGPLTIIFEAEDNVPPLLTGGTGKVAVRIPGKGPALDLATAVQVPVTATSANPSTKPPAEESTTIAYYFGDSLDLIIDAGRTPGGKPSTIVDVTVKPPRILREGSVLLDSI